MSACYLTENCGGQFSGINITLEDMVIKYRLRDSVTFSTAKETLTYKTRVSQGVTEDRVFIDAVRSGDGSKIRSPYSDGIKSLKLAFAANESMETGRGITF